MNQQESLARFANGRDDWNAWAEQMLDARAALEADGSWVEGRSEPEWNAATRDWHAAAAADFTKNRFGETADFSGFVFPGGAGFGGAIFKGDAGFGAATFTGLAGFDGATFTSDAVFHGATFSGHAGFGGATVSGVAAFYRATFTRGAGFEWATFTGDAGFDGATFTGNAGFGGATFTGDAWFDGATFTGNARFEGATFTSYIGFEGATFTGLAGFQQAVFEGLTAFDRATFEGSANFGAIEAKSAFSLAGAHFLAVPDFIQAQFAEAPRLDDCRIEPRRVWPITLARVKDRIEGNPDLAARWRALKRLAIQGHDHAREQAFFKGELTARRWSEDRPWHAVFWFGVCYQVLSDFGRSPWRPVLWWGASVLWFAGLYLGRHPVLAEQSSSGFAWAFRRLTGASGEAPLACVAGPGEPWVAAINLSIHKGLLFLGLVPIDKLNRIHACLYGIHPAGAAQPNQLPASFSPVIPDGVTALSFLQHPLSAVLIFLILLAIRNHFRIK